MKDDAERALRALELANAIRIECLDAKTDSYYVIDTSKAEPEVNWPGENLSQIVKFDEAKTIRNRAQADVFLAFAQQLEGWPADAEFKLGDLVMKKGRASWRGHVRGWYRTDLTALGYAVESMYEPGSVQIYPVSALTAMLDVAPIPGEQIAENANCSAEATSLQKTQTTAERVREACAKVAENACYNTPTDREMEVWNEAGEHIAAAIRSLPIGRE